MNKHPRDICTAAFEDDISRVRQLVTAAGVYSGRWHSSFAVDTNAAAREALARWEDISGNDSGDQGNGGAEMEELLEEEELAMLMAHPALVGIIQDLSLDAGADGDAAVMDEEAEEALEEEREAQRRDITLYKRLLAHRLHRESVAKHLDQHGLLRMSTTPPLDTTLYGILFSCREIPAAVARGSDAAEASEDSVSLQVRWQPSKRSRYAGTPLHWAVLARAHDMVRFLVEQGANYTPGLKAVTNDGSAPDARWVCGEEQTLSALTPALMATANESHPTLDVLNRAIAAQEATRADEEAFFLVLEERLRNRKEAYLSHREDLHLRQLLAAEGIDVEGEEGEEGYANGDDDEGASGDGGDDDYDNAEGDDATGE